MAMSGVEIFGQCCRAIALLVHASCGVLGILAQILCCRCNRDLETPRSRPRSDTMHMKWSRQYYWKASKARCIQRIIIGVAVCMSAYMLYFDTEHLQPSTWKPEDESVNDELPSLSKHIPMIQNETATLGRMAKILILVYPGSLFLSNLRTPLYHEWVHFLLSTWGSRLAEDMELAFLHCLKIADETAWCPPSYLPDSEALLWSFGQAIKTRAVTDWLIVVRPGTHIIPSNLNGFLSTMDSSLPHVIGHRVTTTDASTFHDLNAGIALSFPALVQLQAICNVPLVTKSEFEPPAAKLASCCRLTGIRLSSSSNPSGNERFNPIGVIQMATKPYPPAPAPNLVSLYHSDIREAKWLYSVLSSQGVWAAKSPEQRERETWKFWNDGLLEYNEEYESADTWKDWMIKQLPIPTITGKASQVGEFFMSKKIAANETLIWEYLLNHIVISELKNR